jgi:uncharacterized Zn finger protein (UPF0148 family)
MCDNCKKCEVKKDGSIICHWEEDYTEYFKDTKQIIFCTGKEVK